MFNILYEIDEDLDSSEIEALKFLCLDHIPKRKQENIKDAKGLFLSLRDKGLLDMEDYFIVAELLYIIKRFKLLGLLGTSRQHVQERLKNRVDSRTGISSYRRMLYELSEDVTDEELKSVKFFLSEKIQRCKLDVSASFLDVLIEMEKQEILGEDMLSELEGICKRINVNLVQRIMEYKQSREALSDGSLHRLDSPAAPTESPGGRGDWIAAVSPVLQLSQSDLPSIIRKHKIDSPAAISIENLGENKSAFPLKCSYCKSKLCQEKMSSQKCIVLLLTNLQKLKYFLPEIGQVSGGNKRCIGLTFSQMFKILKMLSEWCVDCMVLFCFFFYQSEVYNMRNKPRGYCIIINNKNFDKGRQRHPEKYLKDRIGTDIDAASLTSTFETLDFEVIQRDDLTASEILAFMEEYGRKDHRQRDAFVCCILSHGVKGAIEACDGEPVLIRQITSYFTSSNCVSLIRKPKLFFIQACQGQNKQPGVSIVSDGRSEAQREIEADAGVIQQDTIPDDSDFLLGMATVEDYLSYRSTSSGSFFIQALCKHLQEGCRKNEDILSILTKVNREVSQGNYKNAKQMPEPRYTLTKKLIFPMS
ncbi:CASP8 protein, partial [Atractosteus spatula]|nr:CASP8 protein [Atractosteus spatula]